MIIYYKQLIYLLLPLLYYIITIGRVRGDTTLPVKYIDDYSPLLSYSNGGSKFTIKGASFPPGGPPILKVVPTNGGIEVPFTFNNKLGIDLYIYTSPSPPVLQSSGKRPAGQSSLKYTLKVYENDGTTPYLYNPTNLQFEYIDPIISSVDPIAQFINIGNDNNEITIIGDYFKLSDFDPIPSVYFGLIQSPQVTYLPIQKKLICQIPDRTSPTTVPLVIQTYTQLKVTHIDPFDYVIPTITKVIPDTVIGGEIHTFSIYGTHLLGDDIEVSIGSTTCTNVVIVDYGNEIQCTMSSVFYVPSGTSVNELISMTIDGYSSVLSGVSVEFFTPVVSAVTPKSGLLSGGNVITIAGSFLQYTDTITIGGVSCSNPTPLDSIPIFDTPISCITSGANIPPGTSSSYPVIIKISTQSFSSPNTEQYTYKHPSYISVTPSYIIDKSIQQVMISGVFLEEVTKVQSGTIQLNIISAKTTSNQLYFDIDASQFTPSTTIDIQVFINGGSGKLPLNIIVPTINSISTLESYLYNDINLVIDCTGFPSPMDTVQLGDIIDIKVGGRVCGSLTLVSQSSPTTSQYSCVLKSGATDSIPSNTPQDISYDIYSINYIHPTFKFNYFEPIITSISQSSDILDGGGQLLINGNHLDIVDTVKIDDETVVTCNTKTAVKLDCVLPEHTAGSFVVSVYVGKQKYDATTLLNYVGPSISSIEPIQGVKRADVLLTVIGKDFGQTDTDIEVKVNSNLDCVFNAFLANTAAGDERFTCDLDAPIVEGDLTVTVSVRSSATSPFSRAREDIVYTSHGLSCFGMKLPDGSNSPVEWYFMQKLKKGKDPYFGDYLYMDSTSKALRKGEDLVFQKGDRGYNPLGATFDQYRYYHTMFFQDQVGNRTSVGGRDDFTTFAQKGHGHVKGFFLFDDTKLGMPGIFIRHSNPLFPAMFSTKGPIYNVEQSPYWIGSPEFGQHFFCYTFPTVEHAARYMLYNDAKWMPGGSMPDMPNWPPAQINQYPMLYDLYQYHKTSTPPWPDRPAGGPAKILQSDIVSECEQNANQANLEGYCWWKTSFQIQGKTAILFSKTSAQPQLGILKHPKMIKAKTYDRFIIANTASNKLEGLELWQVIAYEFKKRMFIQFYSKGSSKPYPPNELTYNVGFLHIPIEFANSNGGLSGYGLSGYGNDHSKLGFPVHVARGEHSYDTNENMFCVGDFNRHNGQGKRGGGALCFQNPELSYQYNRMVHKYISLYRKGRQPTGHHDAIIYNGQVYQDVAIDVNGWPRDLLIEFYDHIGNDFYRQAPPNIYGWGAANAGGAETLTMPAMRTTHAIKNVGDEISLIPATGSILPASEEDPLTSLTATDNVSPYFIAFDLNIAYLCDFKQEYVDGTEKCTTYKTSPLIEVGNPPPAPPTYPPAYKTTYAYDAGQRDYELDPLPDFQYIKYIDKIRNIITPLTPYELPLYQILVNPAATESIEFKPPFIIIPQSDTICEESLIYMMIQFHIYQSTGSNGGNLIFNVDKPNWANGLILAISKKLFNEITSTVTKTSNFDTCFDLFSDLPDIADINYDHILEGDQEFISGAGASWDLMNNDFSDGKGGRVARDIASSDSTTWEVLLAAVINTDLVVDGIGGLVEFIQVKLDQSIYQSKENQNLLINHKLIPDPTAVTPTPTPTASPQSLKLLRGMSTISTVWYEQGLVDDDRPLTSVAQLLQDGSGIVFNKNMILALGSRDINLLERALSQWTTIRGQNQGVQILIRDSRQTTRYNVLEYIDRVNRDQYGSVIELCYQTINSTDRRVDVCTPMTLVTITLFLQNALLSSTQSFNIGDLSLTYIPQPTQLNQSQSYSMPYDGIVIGTINNQLCDVMMISQSDFISRQSSLINRICQRVGPLVTDVSSLTGPTTGMTVTISGQRFNSSIAVRLDRDVSCQIQSITSTTIICIIPAGVGSGYPFVLYIPQSIYYNIQQTSFSFSYQSPVINSITTSPSPSDSNGGSRLSISGNNFGANSADVYVFIQKSFPCSPILLTSHTLIVCVIPDGVGFEKSVQVIVGGQSTLFTPSTITSSIFNYEFMSVINVPTPNIGDAGDNVVALGDAFGRQGPEFFISNKVVQPYNYTNNRFGFELEDLVGQQSMTVVAGGQQVSMSILYRRPIITSVDMDGISASGGILRMYGSGWGISLLEIDYVRIGSVQLQTCRPFNTYVECLVPSGITNNTMITASVGGQQLDPYRNWNITFGGKPMITSFKIDGTTLSIYGTNLLAVDAGVPIVAAQSYVNVTYYDGTLYVCRDFVSSTLIQCKAHVVAKTLVSLRVMIRGVSSDLFSIPLLSGRIYSDVNENYRYDSGDALITTLTISLRQGNTNWFPITSTGIYSFNLPYGNYNVSISNPATGHWYPLTLFPVTLSPGMTLDIYARKKNNYQCNGSIKSSRGTVFTFMYGWFDLTKYGLCTNTSGTVCGDVYSMNPSLIDIPSGCNLTLGQDNSLSVTFAPSVVLDMYMDPFNGATGTFAGLENNDFNLSIIFTVPCANPSSPCTNLVRPIYGGSSNGRYIIDIPSNIATMLVVSPSNSLVTTLTNMTYKIVSGSVYQKIGLFINRDSNYRPPPQFTDNVKTDVLRLPCGIMNSTYITSIGWLNRPIRFTNTIASLYRVYVYDNVGNPYTLTNITSNYQVVNPKNISSLEIVPTNLFNYPRTSPLPRTTLNVTFNHPFIQTPALSIDGVKLPCWVITITSMKCQFPSMPITVSSKDLIILLDNQPSRYQYTIYYPTS